MQPEYDAVILGGGPAGSYFAYKLAEDGFKVALLDKKKSPLFWDKTCGSVTSAFLKKMVEFDLERFILNDFEGFTVNTFDLERLSDVLVDLLVIDRSKLGAEIIRTIEEYDAKIFDQVDNIELLLDQRGLRGLKVVRKNGDGYNLTSRVTIDASGVDGVIRERMKTWVPEATFNDEDLVLAYIEFIRGKSFQFEKFQLFISNDRAPGGYAWVTPISESKIIVGIGAAFTKTSLSTLKENLNELKRKLGISGEIERSGSGLLPVRRPLPSFIYNGFAMIGDSASQGNPFFGGGIEGAIDAARFAYRSIRKAMDTGEYPVLTIEDLWSYNLEFNTKKGSLLAMIDLLRLLAQSLNDKELKLIAKNLPKSFQFDLMTLLNIGLKLSGLIFRPRFLWKTIELVKVADKVRDIYKNYPEEPEKLGKWVNKVNKIFKKYTKTINKM